MSLGVKLARENPFFVYRQKAMSFLKEHMASVFRGVSGGEMSPGVGVLIAHAAFELAWSRYFFDKAANETASIDQQIKLKSEGSKSAQACRGHLLAAYELCSREAKTRGLAGQIFGADLGALQKIAADAEKLTNRKRGAERAALERMKAEREVVTPAAKSDDVDEDVDDDDDDDEDARPIQ